MMVTPKAKYFLLSCCFCFALIITLNKTNEGIIYQRMVENLTERFIFRETVLKLTTTLEPPTLKAFPNISKSVVTEASSRGIYVFTAFKRLSENNQTGLFINGWEDKPIKNGNLNVHCCFLLSNGGILSSLAATRIRFIYNPQLFATLYMCNAPPVIKMSEQFAVSVTVVDRAPPPHVGPLMKAVPMIQPKQAPKPLGPQAKPPVKKPMRPPPPRKPVPPKTPPVKKPMSVSANQTPANIIITSTVDIHENKDETINNSDVMESDAQTESVTSRKLLSIDSSLVDDDQSNKNNISVKQMENIAASKAESKPVIKSYNNIVCPTDHKAYVMPYEALEVKTVKLETNTYTDASDGSHLQEQNANIANIAHVINNSKTPARPAPNGRSAPVVNLPKEKPFSFAVCGKIIYGHADVELTIEWMEYYRRMGASKVLAFTYNLTEAAQNVIKHYEEMGFLETLPYEFPRPDNPKRSVGQKNAQVWNDEHVTIYHCYDRLFNYKFVGIIDFDEFIIPHKDRNFEELFERLLKSQKYSSDFMFPHMVHVQEWKKTRQDSLKIASYLDHTKNLGYNLKAVYMPDRINEGKVFTHGLLEHRTGLRTVHVLGTIAQLSHYRMKCRPEWVKKNNCFNKTLERTTRILELADENLRTTIQKTKQLLLNIN